MSSLVYLPENLKTSLTLNDAFVKMGMKLTQRATFLIPDLQRGFVWKTKEITNLVDSLLKGWPFGQILIAKTGELSPLFSPRTFYSKLIEFGNEESRQMECEWSAETCLILDGQQRLQSLFLALAPCSGGLIFDQKHWMKEYKSYSEYKSLWSGRIAPTAYLALNVSNFCETIEANQTIDSIDYSSENPTPVLEWVFDTPVNMTQLWNRQNLLPRFLHNPWDASDKEIRYIPLKDFWEASSQDELLTKYPVPADSAPYVAAFWGKICMLKKTEIPYTLILSQKECGCSEDEYSEMIISIFTRLNAGGVRLSREDITFSWIKRYWGNTAPNPTAEDSLKDLKKQLGQLGLDIESDYLIRLLSNVWATVEHEGKVLVAQDFLNGNLLKQIAVFLQKNWNIISLSVCKVADILHRHKLRYKAQFYSLDGVFLIVIWQVIAKLWAEAHPGAKQYSSVNFDSLSDAWIEPRVDRLIFAGQWGNSFGSYIPSLYLTHLELQSVCDYEQAFEKLSGWFNETMNKSTQQAKINIAGLNSSTKSGVKAYTTHLWCWQRLEENRRILSNTLAQARGGVSIGEPNVDHCVAWKFWETFIAKTYPVGSDIYNEKRSQINQLGNCNVLSKSINCSKNDYTMEKFFSLLNFGEKEANILVIPKQMFAPDTEGLTPDDILCEIEERTRRIKADLNNFLDGKISLCR